MSELTDLILIEIRDEIRSTNTRLDQTRVELRDEIRSTNARLDDTNARLDGTNARVDQMRGELRAEIVGAELRMSTRIVEQTAATRDLYQLLSDRFDLRSRVERCEHEIDEIKKRVG